MADKVKVLQITDIKGGTEKHYTSRQIDILQNVVSVDEGAVTEHLGNTFVVEIENVEDSKYINEAVYAGAKEMTMYRTGFNIEVEEDLEKNIGGQWIGFADQKVAYFKSKGDAEFCEEILERLD